MRRWIVLLAKCYPRSWRERYGVEFDALMEDVEPDWREFANILGGAVKLQLMSETGLWKIAGVMVLLGMVAGGGVSLLAPRRYVSTALVRVTPPAGRAADQVAQDVQMMQQEILSRSSLAEMIQRPSLNLYRGERYRMPMEEVFQKMRRDIEIRRVPGTVGEVATFTVSFAYSDRFKAQAVASELSNRLVEQNIIVTRNRESLWRDAWHENAPPAGKVEVAKAATDPRYPETHLALFLERGLGGGLLLGVLVFATARHTRVMRQLAICGLAGVALGVAVSSLIPEKFTSNAVMRITPPFDPPRWYAGTTPEPVALRVRRWERAVRGTLNNVNPEDIRIEMISAPLTAGEPPNTFWISATSKSAVKAQSMVREVITGFMDRNILEARSRPGDEIQFMEDHKMGPNLEVLDPPSLRQYPASPNRVAIAGVGLFAGLLAGAAMAWRHHPRRPATGAAVQPI